ncbi:MAG: hypothetical protein QXE79_02650 [Candidatus Bathyarchaeia archaeon]
MSRDYNIGMQVHAHDIKFEGINTVIKNMKELGCVKTAYLMCNYYEDRHPAGKGELPHNPLKRVYHTQGGLFFTPHPEHYKKSILKPQRTPDPDLKDFDALKALTDSAKEYDMRVLAWILALQDAPLTSKYEKYCMVDVYGDKVYGWLCPSRPEVRKYVYSLIEDIATNYCIDGIFFDRFRFPEWAPPGRHHMDPEKIFDPIFTCFCRECRKRAEREKINLPKTRKIMQRIAQLVKENRIPALISKFQIYKKGCLDLTKIFVDIPEISEWINHRQEIITEFVEEAEATVKNVNPKLEFSLDLWPPSYSWLLGQNYRKLKNHCDSLKYFVYHKMGGGEDLKTILSELKKLNPDLETSAFLAIFYRFFGFSGPDTLEELSERGLTVDFIPEETLKALDETRKEVKIYPGIQIFDVDSREITEAVDKAFEADIDGIVAFCYGWATLENIESFGRAMKKWV